MTTFEEYAIECYFNLLGYFTVRNIPFRAAKKRKGGKGRGEIDILAVRIRKGGKLEDAIHIEIGVSASSKFPWLSPSHPAADEIENILKKLFHREPEQMIERFLHGAKWRNLFVTSEFYNDAFERASQAFVRNGAQIIRSSMESNVMNFVLEYPDLEGNTVRKEFEIISFQTILNKLAKLFSDEGWIDRSFQDPHIRALQHLFRQLKRAIKNKQKRKVANR